MEKLDKVYIISKSEGEYDWQEYVIQDAVLGPVDMNIEELHEEYKQVASTFALWLQNTKGFKILPFTSIKED